MSRANPMIIAVVALATLGGCTTVRYPMLPAWSSAAGQAMARPDADRAVQARIAEIENLRQTKRCSA